MRKVFLFMIISLFSITMFANDEPVQEVAQDGTSVYSDVKQSAAEVWNDAKESGMNITDAVKGADNFWDAVEKVSLWLKETAVNVYNIFRLQYRLEGAIALTIILVWLLFIYLIGWLSYKYILNNPLEMKEDGRIGAAVGSFIVLVITIGVGISNLSIYDVLPLINPDYYIVKDLLQLWN